MSQTSNCTSYALQVSNSTTSYSGVAFWGQVGATSYGAAPETIPCFRMISVTPNDSLTYDKTMANLEQKKILTSWGDNHAITAPIPESVSQTNGDPLLVCTLALSYALEEMGNEVYCEKFEE